MHSIERYGIVALLFLVVTVVAVLMWDGGKGKKKDGAPGGAQVQAAAAHPREDLRPDRDGERRLSLVADAQPGPLVRQPRGRRPNAQSQTEETPEGAVAPQPENESVAPLTRTPAVEEPAPAPLTPREEPVRDPVVGRATPPPAASSAATHAYVVQSGDTLSEIAQHELGSAKRWQEIVAANTGLDPGKLQVGKSIQIPGTQLAASTRSPASASAAPKTASKDKDKDKVAAPAGQKTWTVGKGENLWKIAERALGDGKRWKEIAALNPRANPDRLVLGQVLTLPAASSTGTASTKKTDTKPKSGAEKPTLVASNTPSTSSAGRVR